MERVFVLGLDTASDRWHAVLRDNAHPKPITSFQEVRPSKGKNKEEPDVRRRHLHDAFRRTLAFDLPERIHIFCEEPLALKNGKTTRLLGLAAGAIQAAHYDFDVFWHWVDVASWKKDVCGNGNIDKAGITAFSLAELNGHEDWDEDHHDANCLADYGVQWLKDAVLVP